MIDDIDLEEVRELTKKDVPIVGTLTKMSTTVIGFYPKLSNGNIYIIISLLAVIFFIIPVVFVMISITLTIRLQTLKLILSPQTYSMHRMLHK
uniref:Uncharacterized protein n=1 Tax=Panagrolaimus davidi TaxID=227884 RepID=A0A914R138_9BILA